MTPAKPKRADDGQIVVPDFVIDTLARCLLPQMQAYFASPEGQAAFEEYKKQCSSNVLQNTYKGD